MLTAAVASLIATGAEASLSCSVGTSPLTFAPYDPTSGTDGLATGYVEVRCNCTGLDCVLTSYKIEIGADHGTVTNRQLQHATAGDTLNYSIYRDLLRLSNFGTGSSGLSVLYPLAGMGSYARTPVYGKIPGGQTPRSGDYQDNPPITITY